MSKEIRLFIIECVDPIDLLQDRSEAKALEQVCKIIGHEVAVLSAYSKQDFKKYCKYISSIDVDHDFKSREKVPLCIHISAHGNQKGIGFGGDFLKWSDMFEAMKPIFTELDYDGDVFLAISACEAGKQELSNRIIDEKEKNHPEIAPPKYIIVTSETGGVDWDDALVSWTLFYHKISGGKLKKRASMQSILDTVKSAVGTDLKYYRWLPEKRMYKYYSGESE